MFEIHCGDLIAALATRVDSLAARLLQRVSRDHMEANKKWVQVFFCRHFRVVTTSEPCVLTTACLRKTK